MLCVRQRIVVRLPRALTLKKVSRAIQGLVGAIFLRLNELFRRGTGRAVAASEQYIFRIIYVGWQPVSSVGAAEG